MTLLAHLIDPVDSTGPLAHSCTVLFNTLRLDSFLLYYLFLTIVLWWWLVLHCISLFKGHFSWGMLTYLHIHLYTLHLYIIYISYVYPIHLYITFTKVIIFRVCSFMSYLFVNICSLPHDCYIFTCNKILYKTLQETFALEIKNDKLKKWLSRKLFLPQAIPPTSCA